MARLSAGSGRVKDQRCRAVGQSDHGGGEHPPVKRQLADSQLGERYPQDRYRQREDGREQDRDRDFPYAVDVAAQAGVLAGPPGHLDGGRVAQEQGAEKDQIVLGNRHRGAGHRHGRAVYGDNDHDVGDEPSRVPPYRPLLDRSHSLGRAATRAEMHALLLGVRAGVRAQISTVARCKSNAPYCHRSHAPPVKPPLPGTPGSAGQWPAEVSPAEVSQGTRCGKSRGDCPVSRHFRHSGTSCMPR